MNYHDIARAYDRESDALNDLLWERDYRIEQYTERRSEELYSAIRQLLADCGFSDESIREIAMQQAEKEAEAKDVGHRHVRLGDEI